MKSVFLLGNPRSGTTLYRLMLTSHSKIVIPPESHFFLWWHQKYCNWTPREGLTSILNDIFTSTKIETWHVDRGQLEGDLRSAPPANFGELVERIYLAFDRAKNPDYWGDKNSLWTEKFHAIQSTFPDTIVLHIIRDGRDVACSYRELSERQLTQKYAPNLPSDIEAVARLWKQNNEAIARLGASLGPKQYLKIRYEDLVRDTATVLSTVTAFLELDFELQMLEYFQLNRDSFLEPKEFLAWKEKILSPPDPSNIGKYRDRLTSEETERFTAIANSTLVSNGYL